MSRIDWTQAGPVVVVAATVALTALLSRLVRRRTLSAWFFGLPGVILHESAHWLVATLTFGYPTAFRPFPTRLGKGHWALGSVGIRNITPLNAAPIALAPLSMLPLGAWGVWAISQSAMDWRSPWYWAAIYVTAMCFTDAWPSRADYAIAWRSWPAVVLIALAGAVVIFLRPSLR